MSFSNIIQTLVFMKLCVANGKLKKPSYSKGEKTRNVPPKRVLFSEKPPALENFRVESKVLQYRCNFCKTNYHFSFFCKKICFLRKKTCQLQGGYLMLFVHKSFSS